MFDEKSFKDAEEGINMLLKILPENDKYKILDILDRVEFLEYKEVQENPKNKIMFFIAILKYMTKQKKVFDVISHVDNIQKEMQKQKPTDIN